MRNSAFRNPNQRHLPRRRLCQLRGGHRLKNRLPEERDPVRQAESRTVVEKQCQWLDTTQPGVTPKSKLGQELAYLDAQWPRLTVFLEYGEVKMTSKVAEDAILPFAVGRKN